MDGIRLILGLLRAFLLPRTALVAENLALRQQLAVLQVSVKRPRLRTRDRIFWVWLSRLWSGWGVADGRLKSAAPLASPVGWRRRSTAGARRCPARLWRR